MGTHGLISQGRKGGYEATLDKTIGYCTYYPRTLSYSPSGPYRSLEGSATICRARRDAPYDRSDSLGIHPRNLYSLRDHGEVEEVARGIYRLANAPPLKSPDLVSVAIRAPKTVICLISALTHPGSI